MTQTAMPLNENPAFTKAVDTAREHLSIQVKCVIESARTPLVIVRKACPMGYGEGFHVYNESAWTKTEGEQPMLPWSAPTGEKVAVVGLDGELSLL